MPVVLDVLEHLQRSCHCATWSKLWRPARCICPPAEPQQKLPTMAGVDQSHLWQLCPPEIHPRHQSTFHKLDKCDTLVKLWDIFFQPAKARPIHPPTVGDALRASPLRELNPVSISLLATLTQKKTTHRSPYPGFYHPWAGMRLHPWQLTPARDICESHES
jgi:hypothetical protein